MTNQPFNISHPELAAEWHPTKNAGVLPTEVTAKSVKRVWWKCPHAPDHEWDTRVTDRVKGPRCPFCLNYRLSVTNSLLRLHPFLVGRFHPTKNAGLVPEKIIGTGYKKYWWRCDKGHEWHASIKTHVRNDGTYRDCPACKSQSFIDTHPELAKQWHPTKNESLDPRKIIAGSPTYAWWKCPNGPDHEWRQKLVQRTREGSGCPFCDGKKVSNTNTLTARYPSLATEWHPTKNRDLKPDQIFGGGKKKYWWKCPKGDDHEWEASIAKRAAGQGCSICRGLKVAQSTCLATTHPELAAQWHPTKNGDLTPFDIIVGSQKPVWWLCISNPSHEWKTSCKNRAKNRDNFANSCPFCLNHKVCDSNSLAATDPDLAKEWHPTKNGGITPNDVTAGSGKLVWWQCIQNPDHEWEAKPVNRKWGTGCPWCNKGWTIEHIRRFVTSLLPHLGSLTPAGLYVIFQQNGLLSMANDAKGHSFIQALKTGRFPKEELDKFAQGQPSLVDEFINDRETTLDTPQRLDLQASEHSLSESQIDIVEECLPTVETKNILAALESKLFSSHDREVMEFFIKEAVARIWQHAFSEETQALQQLNGYKKDGCYAQEVKSLFLADYSATKALTIPDGYSFPYKPNLMQKYTAYLVKSRKRLGNWSGTGAGKTLSAILASRVIEAKLIVICCPNNVIDNWERNIRGIYPDSFMLAKKIDVKQLNASKKPTYLILNYEFFQQPSAESKLKKLLADCAVDFVIVDEIHYSKQREAERISDRKRVVASFLSEAAVKNPDLHVLGMSATPVINNLFEGKTLIELVTGVHHDDLQTKPTLSNCISHYQKFVSHGIRWLPKYSYKLNLITEEIDCSSLIPEIRQKAAFGSMVDLEAVLTKAKIPFILQNIRPKTVVYTHYLKDILIPIQEAIEQAGWKVTVFTGENKDGLDTFIDGDADVLIASSCVGTGVDRLQHVSNRLIVNSLPWTHAEFEQLIGRFYRQGQRRDFVDVLVPLTFATINGEKWTWCESRWKRIQFKKSISDAAVDGVIPEGHLRTPGQAYKDAMSWLERLNRGELYEIERRTISIALSDEITPVVRRKFGNLSQMNYRINHTCSAETHHRFQEDPAEWEHYHAVYREDRKHWPVVPYEEALKWFKARPHMTIGDFGCGEAFLAADLENKVYSFDHIAINLDVVACNMAHVPLDEGCLDAAVFSLSLMGSDFLEYLKEAYRCLKLDGYLWVAEPTSRIKDISLFKDALFRLGFDVIRIDEKWKFIFIKAIKSERDVNLKTLEALNPQDFLD